jgi:hypothetical protein
MAVARREFPEQLSICEIERTLRFAEQDKIALEQVYYAVETARGWARSKNKRMADWPSFLRIAWRNGWVLDGFERWVSKRKSTKRSVRGDVVLTKVDAVVTMQEVEAARRRGHPEKET